MDDNKKALEIIIDKNVNVRFLEVSSSLENYNSFCKLMTGSSEINEEQYDFLKNIIDKVKKG